MGNDKEEVMPNSNSTQEHTESYADTLRLLALAFGVFMGLLGILIFGTRILFEEIGWISLENRLKTDSIIRYIVVDALFLFFSLPHRSSKKEK